MKVYFHNDLDGRCAAAIVWRTFPKNLEWARATCEFIEIDYKDVIDTDAIDPEEQIIIVDFSFKPEVMEKVLLKTQNIIWIDHHKTAFEYKYSKELDGLRNNDFSGCELAWKYFMPNQEMPRAVVLIGDRDKWAWKFGEETAHFNQGMKLYPHQPGDDVWDNLLQYESKMHDALNASKNKITKEGATCLIFRDNFCADYAKSYGFETEFEGYKCFALGLYMFGSETFGGKMDEYNICLSFEFDGAKWIVGLYSTEGGIDVSEIAKKYGGGGHKGAAGFTCDELPFRKIGG